MKTEQCHQQCVTKRKYIQCTIKQQCSSQIFILSKYNIDLVLKVFFSNVYVIILYYDAVIMSTATQKSTAGKLWHSCTTSRFISDVFQIVI